MITRMVRLTEEGSVDMEQVSLLMGKNYVLTFQERYGDILDPVRNRFRNGKGRPIRRSGSDYLTYVIVDTIVDGFYPVIWLAMAFTAVGMLFFFRKRGWIGDRS